MAGWGGCSQRSRGAVRPGHGSCPKRPEIHKGREGQKEVTKEISFLRILKKALATLPDLCDLCVSLSFALAGKQIASVIAG